MGPFDNNLDIDSIPKLHLFFADLYSRELASPLHIFITFSQSSMEKLPELASLRERQVSFRRIGTDIYSIKIRLRKRGANGWLITKKNIWIFYFTAEESPIVGNIAYDWISGMSPFISYARIPPTDLFNLLDLLNDVTTDGITIQDYLTRSYRQDRHPYRGRKDWASQKGWTWERYDRGRLEKHLTATNSILQAVKLEFPNKDTSFSARISRNGHITFYKGQEQGYSNFYNLLIDNYIIKSTEYRNTLNHREAKITKEEDIVNPIIFHPRKPIGIPTFDLMIDAVTAEPTYMISVIHEGNPWLYLSIVDRTDGNSCELYGFEDEIQIIPLLKATPEGLAKLEDLVYEVIPGITKTQV